MSNHPLSTATAILATLICTSQPVVASVGNASATDGLISRVNVLTDNDFETRFSFEFDAATLQRQLTRSGGTTQGVTRWVALPPVGEPVASVVSSRSQAYEATSRGGWRSVESIGEVPTDRIVKIGKPVIFRGVRLAPLTILPLNVDETGESATVLSDIDVDIQYLPGGDNPNFHYSQFRNDRLADLLRDEVINPGRLRPPGRDLAPTSLWRMLILYPAALDEARGEAAELAQGEFEAFIDWKQRQGFSLDVEAVDTEELDAGEIKRDVVQPLWDEARDAGNPYDYILIVGDNFPDPIASDTLNWDEYLYDEELLFPKYQKPDTIRDENGERIVIHERDLTYFLLEGEEDDSFADVAFGRMWCRTFESLAGAFRRSIDYQRDPYIDEDEDGAWFLRGLVTVEREVADQADIPPYRRDVAFWERDRLRDMGYQRVDYIWQGNERAVAEAQRERLEAGVSLVFADSWLTGSAPPVLDGAAINGRRQPFIVANGQYYENKPIYLWFNSATVDEPNGPIGALTTYKWDRTDNIMDVQGRTLRSLCFDGVRDPGSLVLLANLELLALAETMEQVYGAENNQYRDGAIEDSQELHVFGDPSLNLFTAIPQRMFFVHKDEFSTGESFVGVTVLDGDENPLSGVTVCIRQPDRFQYVQMTDVVGDAAFTIPGELEEGALQITAWGHNMLTYTADVDVVTPEVNLVLGEVGFDDSEAGDDDGLFRNGEEVTLTLSIRNLSEADADGIEGRLFTDERTPGLDEPALTFSDVDVSFGDIGGGESAALREDVTMTLAPHTPAGTPVRVGVLLNTGEALSFEIETSGPRFFTDDERIEVDNFSPGSNAMIMPILANRGDLASDAVMVELVSLDDSVTVTDGERNYPAIDPDDEAGPDDTFEVHISPFKFRGDSVRFELRVWADEEHWVGLPFGVRIEGAQERDPLGPDNYGYICFDSRDTAWAEAPEYRWREINWDIQEYEFRGSKLDMRQDRFDESIIIPLPFDFQYYGVGGLDSIVVCSNGWLSFDLSSVIYNAPEDHGIPGWGCPPAQVCVYWDDLLNSNFELFGVFTHYVEEEGIFIIEWSNMGVDDEAQLFATCQVILRDPAIYPTPTGDGEIILQYREFNEAIGLSAAAPYETIGIRDWQDSDGIQYAYRNVYAEQASPLTDGMALKFTTTLNLTGGAMGRVVQASDNEPIQGAVVSHPYFNDKEVDDDGYFNLCGLNPGRYEGVRVEAEWFNALEFDLDVEIGATADLGLLELTRPELGEVEELPDMFTRLSISPESDPITATMVMHNSGDGELEYRVTAVTLAGDPPPLNEYGRLPRDLFDITGSKRCGGVVFVDSLYYIPAKAGGNDLHSVYIIHPDGSLIDSIDYADINESDNGIFNITWDGEKFWGIMQDLFLVPQVIAFDRDGNREAQFPSPLQSSISRAICYSPERGSLFIADHGSDLVYEISPDGDSLNTIILHHPGISFKVNGLGWNPYDFDGMPLYVLEDSSDINNARYPTIHKVDPETGARQRLGEIYPRIRTGSHNGISILTDVDLNHTLFATVKDPGGIEFADTLKFIDLGPNLRLITAVNGKMGVIPPGEAGEFNMDIHAPGWPLGIYEFGLRILTNTENEQIDPYFIGVRVTVTRVAVGDGPGLLPAEFELSALYPNPFNSSVRIDYALDRTAPLSLKVYDLTGRLAAELLDDQSHAPGRFSTVWQAGDMPAGMFFVRLESGERNRTAKLVMVK